MVGLAGWNFRLTPMRFGSKIPLTLAFQIVSALISLSVGVSPEQLLASSCQKIVRPADTTSSAP